MKHFITFCLFLISVALFSCQGNNESNKSTENHTESTPLVISEPSNRVVLSSEIKWQLLNPARGDQSPRAGTIWGDRKGTVATGFLAKFVDGFSSPPHIHNVTYRAVVIEGLVHNDDPSAENMWMEPGSFWTQPKGASHITSAKGLSTVAYVEIDQGPYLVKPVEESFESGELPVNMDASNVIWLGEDQSTWIDSESNAELSFLWKSTGNDDLKGLFLKLPMDFEGAIHSTGSIMHAIVVKGQMNYEMPDNKEIKELDPGSYFTSTGQSVHSIANKSGQDLVVYVRTNGKLKVH